MAYPICPGCREPQLVAELLTFQDFRIDFLKLSGTVRGTGTDFRWLGELQAAAASAAGRALV